MAEPEELDETAPAVSLGDGARHGGLSASAWAAVAALGAAAITGAVTLTTHFLPPPETPDPQSVAAASTSDAGSDDDEPTSDQPSAATPSATATAMATAGSAPRSALLDELTGTWSGPARSGVQKFTMTLVVTSDCVEGGPCGTLTTDLLPCVGNITLVKIDDGPAFDFATGSFSSDSSSSCKLRLEGGDYFTLGDDVLSYATGYDGGLRGTLHRVD
ncbi:hypothetical protein [Nocardioides bigeumensis]|uniref:Uncharacterized protein n=1 Tax=Nocardioides bigeumensis TaxID=433657 RepID=A0ABN2XQF8_9ACTN